MPEKGRPASSRRPVEFEERASRGSLFHVATILAVAAAGAVGGLARTGFAEIPAAWPWPTLIVNLVGAFLLGVVVMAGRDHWPPLLMAAISVGLLGAFTTFSTLAGELWAMQDAGNWEAFVSYFASSVGGGWVAAVAGVRLGGSFR